jgi:hypothetical protein
MIPPVRDGGSGFPSVVGTRMAALPTECNWKLGVQRVYGSMSRQREGASWHARDASSRNTRSTSRCRPSDIAKAGAAITLKVRDRKGHLGTIEIGQGSLRWKPVHGKSGFKRIPWWRVADALDNL